MDKRIPAFCILCVAAALVAGCMAGQAPAGAVTPSPGAEMTILPAPTPMNAMGCTAAADCVPAQCCHPAGCINKVAQKPCDDVICTMNCAGPLDCGAGTCGCVRGTCSVVPAGQVNVAPSFRLEATPQRYSPLMSSTPGIALTINATGIDTASTGFTWTASYGKFLSWNPPDYPIDERGTNPTSHGETIYWSFIEKPASAGEPVTVTVTARDAAGTVLGNSTLILAWDGDLAVRVQEIR